MFKIQSQQIEKLKPFQFKQHQNTKHHIIDQFLAYTYKYSTFTKMTREDWGGGGVKEKKLVEVNCIKNKNKKKK